MTDFAVKDVEAERVHIPARDGRILQGRIYAPEQPLAVMTVNAATGYRQDFYAPFARATARQGWAVLTYDYRGQGASREGPPASDPARMLDWGRFDMPAAARFVCERYPGAPLDVVGHSVGGHFAPLIDRDLPLRRVALLSSSSGYWGRQSAPLKYFAWLFWRVIGPGYLAARGHVPSGSLWKGDHLPPGVWRDWRDWGVNPDYFRDTLAEEGLLHRYQSFTTPVRAWSPDDDPIANASATRWLLAQFENAPTEMKLVCTEDLSRGPIGHDGLFRETVADVFWPQVWRWLSWSRDAQMAA